jgi:hypothetical protein
MYHGHLASIAVAGVFVDASGCLGDQLDPALPFILNIHNRDRTKTYHIIPISTQTLNPQANADLIHPGPASEIINRAPAVVA